MTGGRAAEYYLRLADPAFRRAHGRLALTDFTPMIFVCSCDPCVSIAETRVSRAFAQILPWQASESYRCGIGRAGAKPRVSVYADTGFLVSLCVLDTNSEAAAEHMLRAKLPILITPFVELELANAISLRLFRNELLPSQIKAARALVQRDLDDGVLLIKALTTGIFEKAKQLARRRTPRFGMRTPRDYPLGKVRGAIP